MTPLACIAGATGDGWIHDPVRVSCVAILADGTMVDHHFPIYEPSGEMVICTTNEACGTNCAIHDTILKLLGMTERERVSTLWVMCLVVVVVITVLRLLTFTWYGLVCRRCRWGSPLVLMRCRRRWRRIMWGITLL